ncbi:variable surface protein, partial [Plasmodium gonderi]
MGTNIYVLVNKFSSWKKIIDGYKEENKNTYQSECNKSDEIFSHLDKFNDKEICYKSMYYLNDIQGKYPTKNHAGCIYLYYWLYDNCKTECNSTEIKNIFNKFIEKYESTGDPIHTDYKKINITKDEFERLKDIYSLNPNTDEAGTKNDEEYCDKFKSIYEKHQKECDYNTQSHFCNALE